MLSERALRRIVAEAGTLGERLAGVVVPAGMGGADDRFERWRKLAAKGNRRRFAAQLRALRLDEERARRILGRVRMSRGTALPEWAETLRRLSQFPASRQKISCLNPVPFADVYEPMIEFARAELKRWFAVNPLPGFERELVQQLSGICGQALYLDFGMFRSVESWRASRASDSGTMIYDKFVLHICRDGFAAFFREYPALARLVACTIQAWIESCAEIIERSRADQRLIAQAIIRGEKMSRWTQADAGLSNAHDGGKTVAILTNARGGKVVYKPRDLGVEKAFSDLLARINAAGFRPALFAPQVVTRAGYGWMEFVAQKPCRSVAEIRRFYQRVGALIALVHALRGTDCHHENLIAHGEHPVLVDLEALLHFERVDFRATSVLELSILRTGFLPIAPKEKRPGYDVAALGGSINSSKSELLWDFVNTDRMNCRRENVATREQSNVPYGKKKSACAADFVPQIQRGFRRMNSLWFSNKNAEIRASALALLRGCQVRKLHRSTSEYLALIERSLHPQFLTSGVDRSLEFEALRCARIIPADVIATEIAALENCDVPRFVARVDSADLTRLASNEPDCKTINDHLGEIAAAFPNKKRDRY